MRKKEYTTEQNDLIIKVYENGTMSLTKLAELLGVSRAALKTQARELGYTEPLKRFNSAGIKKEWSKEEDQLLIEMYQSDKYSMPDIEKRFGLSDDTILRRLGALGISHERKQRKKTWLTEEAAMYLANWQGEESIPTIAKRYGVCAETIRKYLLSIGKDTSLHLEHYEAPVKYEMTDEIMEYIKNPRYAAWEVAEEFNLTTDWVKKKRQDIFGRFVVQKDYKKTYSLPEKKVADILDELDIVYYDHHDIGKWNVDFYLGSKTIIEIQGTFSHSHEHVIAKDKKKKSELEEDGYTILYINEEEVDNTQLVIEKIRGVWPPVPVMV